MTTLERAARALCKYEGNPADTKVDGRPMWENYLAEARAVMASIREFPPQDADGSAWSDMIDSVLAEGRDLGG